MDNDKKVEEEVAIPIPEDLAESLRIIIGERPESFQEEFKPNTSVYPRFDGAAFGGESAQQEFLKAKDPVEKKVKYTNNRVKMFDLTDPAQELAYAELLDLIGDPESGFILAEAPKDPQILLDSTAPMGYRAIVVIKIAKPEIYLKHKGSGYKVQKKRTRRKKEDIAE